MACRERIELYCKTLEGALLATPVGFGWFLVRVRRPKGESAVWAFSGWQLRPVGYGETGALQPSGTRRTNHAVPYGTGLLGHVFQALRAWLPFFSPHGKACGQAKPRNSKVTQERDPTILRCEQRPSKWA